MKAFITVVFGIFVSLSAFGKTCDPRFSSNLASSYSMDDTIRYIDFSVTTSKNNCNHFIGVSKGNFSYSKRKLTSTGSSYYLPFQIYQRYTKATIKDIPDATLNNLIVSPTNTERVTNHSFQAVLSVPYRFAPAGIYNGNYQFNLYEGTLSSYKLISTQAKQVNFYYEIKKNIGVSVVEKGAPFDLHNYNSSLNIDFGKMKVNDSKTFDIVVLSNAGFEVSLSSMNNGQMLHTDGQSSVDYTVSINNRYGRSLRGSETNPFVVARYSGVTPIRGKRISGKVTISNLSNARAGKFSDVIEVIATTLE